jgi:hypothetical protein
VKRYSKNLEGLVGKKQNPAEAPSAESEELLKTTIQEKLEVLNSSVKDLESKLYL